MAETGFAGGGVVFPTVKWFYTNAISTTSRFSGVYVDATETKITGDHFDWWATADNTNWETINLRTFHTFTNLGSDLRIRARLAGIGGTDTYFEDLKVSMYINSHRLSFGKFNGSDNFVDVSHHADFSFTNAFSVALAINVASLPGAEKYVLNKWDGTDGYAVRINSSNQVELIYSNGGSDTVFNTGTALVANTWQHVVFTKDGTALTAYVDGSSVNTDTGGATVGTNANAFEVGKYSADFFSGSLDEVRLYSDELSSSEASDLNSLNEHLTSNVLYWACDNPKLGSRSSLRRPVV